MTQRDTAIVVLEKSFSAGTLLQHLSRNPDCVQQNVGESALSGRGKVGDELSFADTEIRGVVSRDNRERLSSCGLSHTESGIPHVLVGVGIAPN